MSHEVGIPLEKLIKVTSSKLAIKLYPYAHYLAYRTLFKCVAEMAPCIL